MNPLTHSPRPAPEAPPQEIAGVRDPLPPGETVLWQGTPRWSTLARTALHVRKVALYFGVLLVWRVASAVADGASLATALVGSTGLLLLAIIAIGLLCGYAWVTARSTIYAITNRRVFMRVGVAVPIFVNLPFSGIEAAALRQHADGSGDLPLQLKGDVHLAYLHLWPHARAWQLKRPQPMLRAVPQGEQVAATLARALAQANGMASQWNGAAAQAKTQTAQPDTDSAATASA